MLLPDGTRSLNNLLSLSHELCIVTTTDDSTLKAETQELLFEHFNAYYSKALLTELWYRYPKAMLVLQCSQDEPFKDNDETSNGENDTSLDHCTSDVGKSSDFAASTEVKGEEGAETKCCCENELLSPRESVSGSKQDLMSILQTFRNVLLSDRHAKLCNLRVLLTEIRKAMLLKRSRQFVYGKYLIQKKKKDKETKDPMAQPVSLSVNCSEDDATNETLSFNNAVKERMNGEAGNNEGHMVLNKQPKLQEVTGAAFGKDTGKQGSSPTQDRSNNGSHEGATRSEIVTVALQTNDGQLPIDMRFNDSNARLDDLEVEELEVLGELEQYEMKVRE